MVRERHVTDRRARVAVGSDGVPEPDVRLDHAGSCTRRPTCCIVPMNTIEAVLDSARFLRIHRSHIVNVRRIAQLWSIAHGQYLIELRSGQRLYSGRTYGDRIRRALTNPF